MRRRTQLNNISAALVGYLVDRRGLSQSEIADLLEVDRSFISRVRTGQRELSPTHMARIAEALKVPMGAMLLDALPATGVPTPQRQKITDLCRQLMGQADEAVAALRKARSQRHAG